MSTLAQVMLGSAAVLTLIPVTVLFSEVVLAIARRAPQLAETGDRRRLAIIMPAHNEASGIASTLRSIIPQLRGSDRLIVVADNCTDETAAIAAAGGAEVITRTDEIRRGKGYALDFGIRHLQHDPPEILVVIDADCLVASSALDLLARACSRTARPVQSLYLMKSPQNAGVMTRIGEFAWIIKNQVRPLGLHRLGLPCQLMGTGMAFPWNCIKAVSLATGHIVEDLKMGIDLAMADAPPLFCPESLVTSTFPTTGEGIRTQRTRWEHGHLAVILREGPRLLRESLGTLNVGLMAMTLDLCVPPLALLTLVVLVLWAAALSFFLFSAGKFSLITTSIELTLLAAALLIAWSRYGRRVVSFGDLGYALIYSLRKIPLYARFLFARQIDWVRSKRDGDV